MERITEKPRLSKATTKRLSLYLRCLKGLEKNGVTRVKSSELSKMTQVGSATIRRDFSYFGELGRSGYGYDVAYLLEVFGKILNTSEKKYMALIGCGNLGKALLKNNFRRNDNLNIVAAFDTNPQVIDETINHITIQSMEKLKETVKEKNITVAISTVPSQYSQAAVDEIVKSGITAILNFAPEKLTVPKEVSMQYIDLTTELLTLIYYDDVKTKPKK